MTSRGARPPRVRRMKTESSIVDSDVFVREMRVHGWGGGDPPDDVVQVAGSELSSSDMSYGICIMKTSPVSRRVSPMAVCGPGLL